MTPASDSTTERSFPAENHSRRGSNQAGMRAHNERLVLSLVRQHGALAKSDIARITGLSAQTVSVIMRALESDGLLGRGDPVRGRIGQPSVPIHLAADGAYFLGLKIGRRSVDLMLIDFTGQIRAARRSIYRYPTPDAVMAFLADALPAVTAALPADRRGRIAGIGVAMPFQLWSWTDHLNAPQSEMDAWRDRDIQAEVAAVAGVPAFVQNDATAACGAELVFGTGERPRDFLYFYFGYFIGGGLVLNGQLFTGRSGNAAGVGPMPVPGTDGRMHRLLTVASLSALAAAMEAAGENPDPLWEVPDRWSVSPRVLLDWVERAAEGLASAIMSATALLELDAVLIDGWMPAAVRRQITLATQAAFARLDHAGITPPAIREGTIGPQARTLGAAAVPLSQRYLLDPAAMLKEG
jgi:predicted NBD/HSP70 family sugar kinase